MDEASEEVAVQLAAQGVIGKRVYKMESGFIMALDYMIQIAEKDHDYCYDLEFASQADDLLETMESSPVVPDRKLLARLVLIREEGRNMMECGILDERILPESGLNFLTKLVALRPGRT
ncbi:unnamed protein product [Fraxinus pennsylvanica]|uniref:Uncharacterized protein n=1 Tax=Fraxinus pennsylvanica TaxID=56036 RepID=A0AAD2DYS2_9LAMI|nr:unnamed protein product [Fraxinus pennsylvanica]